MARFFQPCILKIQEVIRSQLDDGNKLMPQGTRIGVSALRETILHVLTTRRQLSWSAASAIRNASSTNWSIFAMIVASESSVPSNRKFYLDRPKLGYFSIPKIGISHGSEMGVLKYLKLIDLSWFAFCRSCWPLYSPTDRHSRLYLLISQLTSSTAR